MTFRFVIAALIIGASVAPTLAETFLTGEGALLCVSPFNLKEAGAAYMVENQNWLNSLGCIHAKAGIPVLVIERNSLGWQVRLMPPGKEGITVWGNGSRFIPLGQAPRESPQGTAPLSQAAASASVE
jgi:hypothetical protein